MFNKMPLCAMCKGNSMRKYLHAFGIWIYKIQRIIGR